MVGTKHSKRKAMDPSWPSNSDTFLHSKSILRSIVAVDRYFAGGLVVLRVQPQRRHGYRTILVFLSTFAVDPKSINLQDRRRISI